SVLFAPAMMPAPPQAVTVFDISPLAREIIVECRDFGPDGGSLSPYARSLFEALAAVVLRLAERPSPLVLPVPVSAPLRRALDLTETRANGTPTFAAIARESGQSPRA